MSNVSVTAKWRKPISSVETANEIGEDAVEAVLVRLELLVLVGRNEQFPGRHGKKPGRPQILAGARVGQVEMQP
jgi:hypothetical protein